MTIHTDLLTGTEIRDKPKQPNKSQEQEQEQEIKVFDLLTGEYPEHEVFSGVINFSFIDACIILGEGMVHWKPSVLPEITDENHNVVDTSMLSEDINNFSELLAPISAVLGKQISTSMEEAREQLKEVLIKSPTITENQESIIDEYKIINDYYTPTQKPGGAQKQKYHWVYENVVIPLFLYINSPIVQRDQINSDPSNEIKSLLYKLENNNYSTFKNLFDTKFNTQDTYRVFHEIVNASNPLKVKFKITVTDLDPYYISSKLRQLINYLSLDNNFKMSTYANTLKYISNIYSTLEISTWGSNLSFEEQTQTKHLLSKITSFIEMQYQSNSKGICTTYKTNETIISELLYAPIPINVADATFNELVTGLIQALLNMVKRRIILEHNNSTEGYFSEFEKEFPVFKDNSIREEYNKTPPLHNKTPNSLLTPLLPKSLNHCGIYSIGRLQSTLVSESDYYAYKVKNYFMSVWYPDSIIGAKRALLNTTNISVNFNQQVANFYNVTRSNAYAHGQLINKSVALYKTRVLLDLFQVAVMYSSIQYKLTEENAMTAHLKGIDSDNFLPSYKETLGNKILPNKLIYELVGRFNFSPSPKVTTTVINLHQIILEKFENQEVQDVLIRKFPQLMYVLLISEVKQFRIPTFVAYSKDLLPVLLIPKTKKTINNLLELANLPKNNYLSPPSPLASIIVDMEKSKCQQEFANIFEVDIQLLLSNSYKVNYPYSKLLYLGDNEVDINRYLNNPVVKVENDDIFLEFPIIYNNIIN